jgi:hypothetical protein
VSQSAVLASGLCPDPQALGAAHARLMSDSSLQFHFPTSLRTQPSHLPPWLASLAPFIGWVFIGGLVIGLLLVIGLIVRDAMGENWSALFERRRRPARKGEWRPAPEAASALLADADRLAEAGAYGEAARLILHRSIDDIEGRRPALVRPHYTAREIAVLGELPPSARGAFAAIAAVVERSLFGGKDLDQGGYAACRRTYETFALPGTWS